MVRVAGMLTKEGTAHLNDNLRSLMVLFFSFAFASIVLTPTYFWYSLGVEDLHIAILLLDATARLI